MTTEPREAKPEADAAWCAETPAIRALHFGLATSLEDFDGAFRLLHDRYVWRRYMPPETSGRRVGAHNLLPSTKVIVARARGQVVGTVISQHQEDAVRRMLGLPVPEDTGDTANNDGAERLVCLRCGRRFKLPMHRARHWRANHATSVA
jgi:N-acyl amino acid synthase FeeM